MLRTIFNATVNRVLPFIDWGGKFWRSRISAPERGELPFNRAQREWVHEASQKIGGAKAAFGSTVDLTQVGTPIFNPSPFPALERDLAKAQPLRIGPYCKQPYDALSLYNISAMSYGAISKVAVEALSKGAKEAGCWLNTGEGGLSEYHLSGKCDIVFQIGTAKYGVRDEAGNLDEEKLRAIAAHPEVKMIEIKLSQGAKPGKGGILPGVKVTEEIAQIRGIPAGKASLSPNRFPEVGNVDELLDFVERVRAVAGKPVGFKTVIGSADWIDTLCRKINERGIESAPDFISVDGGDGGTGAAPQSLIDNVGKPLRESLPVVSGILREHGLKERIRVIASGKLIAPADVAWALCAGADFANSARGFMFALGCVQAMRCDKNTCPAGITTHDPGRMKVLKPQEKSVKVANFCKNMVDEVGVIAHSCGVSEPRKLRAEHVDIVQDNGISQPLSTLYPKLKAPAL